MTMRSKFAFALIAAFAVTLAACGKKEEAPKPAPAPTPAAVPAPAPAPAGVTATTVTVGKSIGADKKVTAAAEAFAKGDTIYASVETTGTGSAMLKAKWTYSKGGQTALVKEDTMTVNTTGPAVNEFHIAKPDGWPLGDYEVEVTIDGKPVATKKFAVK
jgi:hypothetical protein